MPDVVTARRLFEGLRNGATPKDFAVLIGEIDSGTKAVARADAADAKASRALVRRYFEMWNTAERAEADAVLGPTYHDHRHPSVVGPAAVRSLLRRFRAEHPQARVVANVVAADSEYVLVKRTIQWSSGGPVEGYGVALFRIADGQLAEQWTWSEKATSGAEGSEGRVALGNYF